MKDTTAEARDEDSAALQHADDYLRDVIVRQNGWELVSQSHAYSPIRGRFAREAVVRKGDALRTIVWDRGLQKFLTPTDLEGERWGLFGPATLH